MKDLALLDAPALAVALETAIIRLGQLGNGGLTAFNELIATKGKAPDFDAGVKLLEQWIGIFASGRSESLQS